MRLPRLAMAAALAAALVAPAVHAGEPDSLIYSFDGGAAGALPPVGLTTDGHGGFLGMTQPYGSSFGAAWDLSPPTARGARWSLTLLTVFDGLEDGSGGAGTLLPDGHGDVFGVTDSGVFELAPPAHPGGPWTRTFLHRFQGGQDGESPIGGLVMDAAGALYGVTQFGGGGPCDFGCGVVFELTPPSRARGMWTETVLHAFRSRDGAYPMAALIMDPAGHLYGTASTGGPTDQCDGGCGVVFTLSPAIGGRSWNFTVIKALDASIGGRPVAALLRQADGELYGAAFAFGRHGCGAVFEVSPPAPGGGAWRTKVAHSFAGGDDGCFPKAPLTTGADGTLYGTTQIGGRAGRGVVYGLRPLAAASGRWREFQLHAFRYAYHHDGSDTTAPVIFGPGGLLYGVAYGGGRYDLGAVFDLAP